MKTLKDLTWKDAAVIEVRSLTARLEKLAGIITAKEIGLANKQTLESITRQSVKLAEAIDQIEEKPRDVEKPRAKGKTPPQREREHFIKIGGKEGGYVDREGYATLDKAKAYRWGSRSAAVGYIDDNKDRLGTMTLEEAPKRG